MEMEVNEGNFFLQAIRKTFKKKFNTLNQCFLDVLYKKMKLNIKK